MLLDYLFQSLGRDSVHSSWFDSTRQLYLQRFQSLGRDSVHSSRNFPLHRATYHPVSIPRSGFCSFKLESSLNTVPGWTSFNPSVGILFIQAEGRRDDYAI